MSVVQHLQHLVTADVSTADKDTVMMLLDQWRRIKNWGDSFELTCAARLRELERNEPAMSAENVAAEASRVTIKQAMRPFDRARTVETIPELGALLEAGGASGAHVDVVTAAMRGLTPVQKQALADRGAVLAKAAEQLGANEFGRQVRRHVDDIVRDGGMSRLERQRRETRLRTWVSRDTGMWCLSGEFDPETGLQLATRLQAMTNTLFHEATPAEAPTDTLAKQQYLAAHALVRLTEGRHGKASTEVMVLIDAKTLLSGEHSETIVDLGFDIELPVEAVRRMACCADVVVPVITADNNVNLHLGRARRFPNRAQRRGLRAMYATCAIPGCCEAFNKTRIHHVIAWEDGGPTDIELLVPLCDKHHHAVHEGGCTLRLAPDRSLTITYPDGTTRSTGPPSRTRAA
jgi:hypothetical protein